MKNISIYLNRNINYFYLSNKVRLSTILKNINGHKEKIYNLIIH